MIIKMQDGDGWKFVDGVGDVRSSYNSDWKHFDLSMFDENIQEIVEIPEMSPVPSTVFVVAHRSNGNTLGVVSNRVVYLLNDSGKTIERLN